MIDVVGLIIIVAAVLLVVAVFTNRIDWFRALIAIVALIVVWYLLAGGVAGVDVRR